MSVERDAPRIAKRRRLASMNLSVEGRRRLGWVQGRLECRTLTDAVERSLRIAEDVLRHLDSGGRVVLVGADGEQTEVRYQ